MVPSLPTSCLWQIILIALLSLNSSNCFTNTITKFTTNNNAHHNKLSTNHYMSKYSYIFEEQNQNTKVNTDIIYEIDTLINERVSARADKNFQRADMIANELLQNHVILDDKELTWRIGTKKEIKKRIAISKKKSNNSKARNNSNIFWLSSTSGPNISNLSEKDILTMLDERCIAQLTRDYDTADRIRNTLKSKGVYIDDGMKEYRYDNVPFKQRGITQDMVSSSKSSRGWGLRQSKHSLPLPSDDAVRLVDDLLRQRSDARSSGNYVLSDSIRDQLYETYNIRIDDKLNEWSCGGSFGDNIDHWTSTNKQPLVGYTKSEMSATNVSPADEAYIQSKVDERIRAKRTRNFELSDSIRDQLYEEYDVTIHDKLNLWSVGGDFGEGQEWNYDENLAKRRRNEGGGHDGIDLNPEKENASLTHEVEGSTREQLESLTVVQLKDMLRQSGLTVSGTKAKLINRLLGTEVN